MKNQIVSGLLGLSSLLLFHNLTYASDKHIISLDLPSGESVDIRQYKADGDKLLLGLACDEGSSEAAMGAAATLSDTSMEIWMPDLLTAHFLPKLQSSIRKIPTEDVVALIDAAINKTNKQVYLIASGHSSGVLLRGLALWEHENPKHLDTIKGAILLYPRLNAGPPEPGKDPVYIKAVGKTKTPIVILEGEKTPNRWALGSLKEKLSANGSIVITELIPGIRGFFYDREQQNSAEVDATSKLPNMVEASIMKLEQITHKSTQSTDDMEPAS